MKNFTKQITNKTLFKPTRWLLMALMMLVGTSSAWGASSFASGDVIYVDVSACSWYESDGCGPGIQLNKTGNYIKMDKVADKLYTYTFAQSVTSFNLGRVSATGTTKYNSFAGNFTNYDPSSKNIFKVNDSSSGGSWGSPSFLKVYFDNSNTNWTNIYMCYGHDSYSKMNVKVNNQACGNIYYAIITDNWTDETQIAFHNSTQAETSWGSEGNSITNRYGWLEGDVTHTYGITLDDANGKVFKPSASTSSLATGNNGNKNAHTWEGTDASVETFSESMCCSAPDAFTISIDETAICSGGDATISIIPDNHDADSYKWCTKNGDDYGEGTTIDNKSFTVSTAGTYVVRAYNSTCMTESNAVTLTVDNTITNMFIGLVNPNGGYYDTNPLLLCDDQVTLKAWATGAKTYKVYKTSDLNNPISSGNVTGNGEEHAISYTIEKSNGSDGYLVKFENTCGTIQTDTKTVTVPLIPTVPSLPTTGPTFDRQGCTDHLQYVNEVAGVNMKYMAVLYVGENVTPTQPTNGTTYEIDNTIGEGVVKVLQDGNAITIRNLDPTQKYTLAIYRYHTTCYEYSERLEVEIDKNVPTLGELTINGNVFSVPVTKISARESGVSLDIMKFQYYNEAEGKWADFDNTATYSLDDKTKAGGVITATITPGTLTQGQPYKVRACVTNNSCGSLYAGYNTNDITYTEPCSTVAEATLAQNVASVCLNATQTVNLNTLAGVNNVNWYKGNNKVADPTQVDIKNAGTTTYVVKAVNGLCESEGVEFTLTVNPLPTITSISASNDEPVPFEDVVLTADGVTPGAEVKWYLGDDDTPVATGTTYIVTSENAGEVIVKAKAFLGDCESDFKEHEVTFGAAEDCTPTPDNTKIEIWCQVTGTTTPNCHAYNITSSGNNGFAEWPGLTHTSTNGDYYIWTLTSDNGLDVSNNKVGIVFSNNKNNKTDDIEELFVGNRYYFTYDASNSTQSTNYTRGDSEPLTTQPPLSAPAVKTVSVNSEQGSGVVNFVGKVIKTGCAADNQIWVGYQYKLATEDWPTTGVTAANQAVANRLELYPLGHPNGLDHFTANIPLTDGTYDFRAYVINGYGRSADPNNYDQGVYYGLSKRVTVSLQQQAITSVTIEHANIDGNTINDPTYCAGTTAYIKLEQHDGTPYKGDVVWTSTANHDFSKVAGKQNLFSYIVKGEDNVTASVKNDENVNYVSSNTLDINVYPVPNMPNFDISKTTICSTDPDGAVITVTNPQVGITYQVYKKVGDNETTHGNAVTYNNGDPNPTINSIKTAGTYFVKAWNKQCDNKVERSLTEAEVTIVDAAANSIAITPTSKEVNPWMPTTFIVNKTGSYNYTLTCTQVGSATVSSNHVNIEYNYSFVPTNGGIEVTFTWTNMNDITGAVAPILQDRTGTTPPNEVRGTGNSVTKLITPNAQGNVIVAAKFEFAGGSSTTDDYTYTNQGDVPANDAIITQKGDTYIIKFPKPADAQIVNGQVTFNPIQYNVTAKLNVDVQGCGTTVATSNVTLTPLTEVCP